MGTRVEDLEFKPVELITIVEVLNSLLSSFVTCVRNPPVRLQPLAVSGFGFRVWGLRVRYACRCWRLEVQNLGFRV